MQLLRPAHGPGGIIIAQTCEKAEFDQLGRPGIDLGQIGKGLIDLPRAFDALRRHNFQGLLALEIDYLHPAYASDAHAVTDSLDYMRSIV